MRVLKVRNVHEALPQGLFLLDSLGIKRETRFGTVLQAPWPVSTVYTHPRERVVMHPERDSNIAFLVYEALWMLAGRSDLKPLLRYVSTFGQFSDDGAHLHGAYGHRWREYFQQAGRKLDQLAVIAEALAKNPEDRRCVLQMWDATMDLGIKSKDIPCNDMATFQRDADGKLCMVVFCRSNDIVWGAYFANAFHFSVLLEYMAHWIGCPVGTYTQVSVNWHGYLKTMSPDLPRGSFLSDNPYTMNRCIPPEIGDISHERFDELIRTLLEDADSGFSGPWDVPASPDSPWINAAHAVLLAHHVYKTQQHNKCEQALSILAQADLRVDWIQSMVQWLKRRQK